MKLSFIKVVNGCCLGKIKNLGKIGDYIMDILGCFLYIKIGFVLYFIYYMLYNIYGVFVMVQFMLLFLVEYYEVLIEYKEGVGKFIGMLELFLYCFLYDLVSFCLVGYVINKFVFVWSVVG